MLDISSLKNDQAALKSQVSSMKNNMIGGMPLGDFIFNKIVTRIDPIEYCERVLRAHLPPNKRHLHENQIELIRAVCNPKVRKVAALMARQAGKCFAKDTEILMADGSIKKVQDIQVGDYVMSPNSTPVLVTALGRGQEEMYEVVSREKHHESFTVNKSHILSLVTRKGKIKNISVEDYLKLSDSQKKKGFRGYRVAVDYQHKDTEIEPYYFGLWLGDTNGPNATKNSENILRNYLQNNDLIANKYITKDFMINSRAVRLQVLAGIIDSDDSKDKRKIHVNSLDMSFVNEKLSEDIVRLLRSLGFRACKSTKNVKFEDRYITNYRVKAYGDFSVVPTKIARKQWTNVKLRENPLTFEFDLVSKGIGDYYGFTIDSEDHLFLLGDYTVAHNTESIASFTGFLLDNYPNMRVGIFTPRVQQAEINVGRTSIFFQMNEEKLNNKLVKCTKQKIELSNGSYVMAVSGSDQSNIEGLTFDIIILDEAQKITNYTWSERIAPMGGACVLGNSKIWLPDGTMITIQELVEKQEQKEILAVDTQTLKLTKAEVTDYVDSGIQSTLKITLDSGRSIQGTLDHPVIIKPRDTRQPKWEQLQNLKVGMQVAVPREVAVFGSIDNKDARLIGMMIGDGTYGDRQIPGYSSEDDELWNNLENNYPDAKVTVYRSHTTEKGKLFREGTIGGIIPILREAGIYGQTKEKKILPHNHLAYTKEALSELLGGLFDTDGNVYIEDNRKVTISLAQLSRDLIEEVQLALLKFGVHGKIRPRISNGKQKYGSKNAVYYVLDIKNKESVENFAKNIKLLVPHKQELLDKAVEVLKNHKHKIQKDLIDTDLRFEKIVSIEDTGLARVFDLTVKNIHNFIANGIYVHNTNAKMIKIGTPKTRNHFYESMEGQGSKEWCTIRRDWTQCPQLWALASTELPDHNDPNKLRPYSTYVLSLMPKALKQEYFPTRPDVWTEGQMSVEDFKTQYMLQFIDGAGQFLSTEEWEKMVNGEFDWQVNGKIGEHYVAGIDFAGSSADNADFTHITVLRIARDGVKQKIYSEEMHGTSYPEQMRRIARLFGGHSPIFACRSIFADFTGCGRPVVETLREEYGLTNLIGITFGASDTFTRSGMNMKNIMFAQAKNEIAHDRFKYPKKDLFLQSAGSDQNGYYHKMIGEWRDLECQTMLSVNKRIEAPTGGHDDVPCADVLANFAAMHGATSRMPKASGARIYLR